MPARSVSESAGLRGREWARARPDSGSALLPAASEGERQRLSAQRA